MYLSIFTIRVIIIVIISTSGVKLDQAINVDPKMRQCPISSVPQNLGNSVNVTARETITTD